MRSGLGHPRAFVDGMEAVVVAVPCQSFEGRKEGSNHIARILRRWA